MSIKSPGVIIPAYTPLTPNTKLTVNPIESINLYTAFKVANVLKVSIDSFCNFYLKI